MNKDKALEKLRTLVESESGIKLGPEKIDLLVNRIRKRLRALSLDSEEQYIQVLESDLTGQELVELINVVSTNHTFFYREAQHFDNLGQILNRYAQEKKDSVRIWCAASSSGEEPYMLSMMVQEHFPLDKKDVKILATDISTRVLHRAIHGVYDPRQLEKLPDDLKAKYFTSTSFDGEPRFQVAQKLKDILTFKKLNLSKFPYPLNGPIDIIFCRNVMIYFDLPLRTRIIHEFERLLSPGGYLFLSLSENTLGIAHNLESLGVGMYRRVR